MDRSGNRRCARWAALILFVGPLPASAATAAGHGDAASCRALAGRIVSPHIGVTSADYADPGASVGATKIDVPFCRVVGVATPTSDSHIGFEVWLPPAAAWNGKFQGEGSGASAGAVSPAAMLVALKAGYASMSTDNGHVTDPAQPNGANEQTWALGHPEKMQDFAFRAMHVSTVAGKAIVRRFYGRDASLSYFVGCSQGGHHALMEATRYPEDYDGIIAGAPAWHWANQMVNAVWHSLTALKDPTALTEQSAALLNRKVIAACDELDGVKDGVIADPRRCTFDPASLQCTAESKAGECLTPVQVAAAQHIYAGATKSDGSRIFPGLPRGSEASWAKVWAGASPGGSSWDFFRYSVFQDRNFDNRSFDFDRDTERALSAKVGGMTVAEVYNVKPDLTRFNRRGGKLIMYHGWADQQVSPFASLDFYQQIAAQEGQAKTDAFLRMFMLPGIGHCSGGPGVGNIGGSTPALQHDAEHDLVTALDLWVTQKKPPSVLIGAHLNQSKEVDRTRPLCAYPREAKYKGTGDPNDAASFTCAAPM